MTASSVAEFGWPGGDDPGELRFPHEVTPALREALLATLSPLLPLIDRRAVIRALTPPIGAVGRFSVAGGGAAYFVRVSARWGEPQLEQAITGYLRDRNLAVNHLEIAGAILDFEGERLRLDVRELIAGRHFNGARRDLATLAGTLAECHAQLRAFPDKESVRENAARRFTRLATVRDAMRSALGDRDWTFFNDDPGWGAANAAWLQMLVEHFEPAFDRLPGAQCLHAQIHRANVLYHLADAQPVLVDWEEAVHTFAPVAWDLAYFIQRFCLHDDADRATLQDRLVAVRMSYGGWVPGISEMMRQIAWLSMVTIIRNRQAQGTMNPLAEYQKFVRLERQAHEMGSLIDGNLTAT
jgi:hypothetical protein